MKNKWTKVLALVACLSLAAAFGVACGDKGNDDTSSSGNSSEISSESAGENSDESSSESSEPAQGGGESSENSSSAGGGTENVQGQQFASEQAWVEAIQTTVSKMNATVRYTVKEERIMGAESMEQTVDCVCQLADGKIYGLGTGKISYSAAGSLPMEEEFTSELYVGIVDGTAFEWGRGNDGEWECYPYSDGEYTQKMDALLATANVYLAMFADMYGVFTYADGTYIYAVDGPEDGGIATIKFVDGLLYSFEMESWYTESYGGEFVLSKTEVHLVASYDDATVGELPPVNLGGGNIPTPPPAQAPSEGLKYTLINDGTAYSVSKGDCQDEIVVIPSEYEGLPVTTIGYLAFYNCYDLTEIVIPDTVTKIDEKAFLGCTRLQNVVIPNSVTTISYAAFKDCTNLTEIVIPSSVTKMGRNGYEEIFYGCGSLTIYCEAESKPDGWYNDWADLYYGKCPVVWDCNNNETADDGYVYTVIEDIRYALKDGVATVANQPDTITVAYIPETVWYDDTSYCVTSIAQSAFSSCRALTEVVIPDGITSIGGSAFNACSSLTTVAIPEGVPNIGVGTFEGCSALTNVGIPDTVAAIGDNAFYGCTSLKEIVIPDIVTNIGAYAFYDCYALAEIRIPKAVISMGNGAFKNCYLTVYCEVESTPKGWDSAWIDSYKSVVWNCNKNDVAVDGCIYTVVDGIRYGIKDGVAEVALQTKNMTTANILETITYKGNSYKVTKIAAAAFHSCKKLTSINFSGTVEQWNSLVKGNAWNTDVPATKVVCDGGEVTL